MATMSWGQLDAQTMTSIAARKTTESPGVVRAGCQSSSPCGLSGMFVNRLIGWGTSTACPMPRGQASRFSSQEACQPCTPKSAYRLGLHAATSMSCFPGVLLRARVLRDIVGVEGEQITALPPPEVGDPEAAARRDTIRDSPLDHVVPAAASALS